MSNNPFLPSSFFKAFKSNQKGGLVLSVFTRRSECYLPETLIDAQFLVPHSGFDTELTDSLDKIAAFFCAKECSIVAGSRLYQRNR